MSSWTGNTCCANGAPLAQSDIGPAVDTKAIDKTNGFKQWNVTSIVQQWFSIPSTNFGLLLNSDPTKLMDRYRYFSSSEGTNHPYLTVVYTPPPVAPILEEDFSTYTSTADMLSDPRGIYALSEDVNSGQMALDQNVAYGTSTKSMRYDFPDRTGSSDRCHDYTIRRTLRFPPQTHVWVELYAKFATNFTTVAPASFQCDGVSTPAYKLWFLNNSSGTSRFQLLNGIFGSRWDAGYPPNEQAFIGLNDGNSGGAPSDPLWDGLWHRYRIEAKLSTTATSGDGIMRLWLDDVRYINVTNINTTNFDGSVWDKIDWSALGANMNQGPDHVMSIWRGLVRVYNQDPGW